MSANLSQRPTSNSRGRGPLRASLGSRKTQNHVGDVQEAHGRLSNGTRGQTRGSRRTSSGAAARGGRQTTPPSIRGNTSHQGLKRPPSQTRVQNRTWKNPASLSAAFQSHAGKVANSRYASWRNPPFVDLSLYNKQMNDLYQTLKQSREKERRQAIKDGFLADPDKPTTLAYAITPVGTCQDMCPEFERVERIVQLMVDGREKITSLVKDARDAKDKVAFEDIMVKRFRRSAAGYDEQLPSDIRPPAVLQKTLNYLINDVVGGPESLSTVHKFVWDRTRSIRNDFSIQQVSKVEDLKIAIDCFERIARFHILSLHQLSSTNLGFDEGEFDPYQEREQLNNTLLSLQYYYEDSRHKLTSPNEAEFRAYGIIFEIQDQRPDTEDRLQNLPKDVLRDRRVQIALRLHAMAGNVSDEQGPLRPRTQFSVAQTNTRGFWSLIQSNAVSYLMACVAEMYFNVVRRTALEAIWKAYKGKRAGPTKMEDWTLKDLTQALGFDDEAQTRDFCEQHDFTLSQNTEQEVYIDLGSVAAGNLTDQNPRRKQIFSKCLVEIKRLGRTLPAIVNGMTASQSHAQGLLEEGSDGDTTSTANNESLFVDEDSEIEGDVERPRSASPTEEDHTDSATPKLNPTATPFNPFLVSAPSSATTFGKPSANSSTLDGPKDLKRPSAFLFANKAHSPSKSEETTEAPNIELSTPKASKEGAGSNDIADHKADVESPRSNLNATGGSLGETLPGVARKASLNRNTRDTESSNFVQSSSAVALDSTSNPAVSAKSVLESAQSSIFDKPTVTPGQPLFSLGTSPFFKNSAVDKKSSHEDGSPSVSLNKKEDRPFLSPNLSTSTQVLPTSLWSSKSMIGPSTSPLVKTSVTLAPSNSSDHKPAFSVPHESQSIVGSISPPEPIKDGSSHPANISLLPQSQENVPSIKANAEERFPTEIPFTFQQTPNSSQVSPRSPNISCQEAHDSQPSQNQSARDSLIENDGQSGPTLSSLNRLSNAIMLEENGLLQQFIEFTVEPIIRSSLVQLVHDQSVEEARQYRTILLSKKYFKKWRTNAWGMNLMRKGRDRRRNFAKSIKELAESTHNLKDRSFAAGSSKLTGVDNQAHPSDRVVTTFKRQSLPSSYVHEENGLESFKGTKRKRNDTAANASYKMSRPTELGHRRSRTTGDSFVTTSQHGTSRNPSNPRIDRSKVERGSMLNEVLMRQARKLAPTARSDTTHSDYFRLKALGVDPNTPFVPQTQNSIRAPTKGNGGRKIDRGSLQDSKPTSRPVLSQPSLPLQPDPATAQGPTASKDNDEEEDSLFAQIRSIREALAESEQWFQGERRSMERSTTTQQPKVSPPRPAATSESPAQRRLREIKERGPTPSRAELRLRAMGDKALLPQGFWDGEGMGLSLMGAKGKEGKVANSSLPPKRLGSQQSNGLIGFAAMTQTSGTHARGPREQRSEEPKAGATVEDAIEL